jgi:Holliday junction resolvase RusA-like endonuclease
VSVALFELRRPHCDVDNQVKSVLDALAVGGALEDDRYVDELSASRHAAEEDYAVVTLRGRRDPWAR